MNLITAPRPRLSLFPATLTLSVVAALALGAPAAHADPPLPLGTMCVVVPPQPVPGGTYTPRIDRCIPWPGDASP